MVDEYFYEDLEPDLDESLGGFKTPNPADNIFQRQFIHLSPERSRFKKTVELVLCVHGWKTPDKKEPMTLLIFGVSLKCHASEFRYQSVDIWLGFHEDDRTDASSSTAEAHPAVTAYAPFVKQKRWNEASASVEDKKTRGVTLGASQFVTAEANAQQEKAASYTRRHFDRGTAERMVNEKTGHVYGVEWYIEQNELQQFGVEPFFYLAVLLDRSHDTNNNPVTFRCIFDMKIEAGFLHDFEQGLRRIFRLNKPEDDPLYFDPSKTEPEVHGLEGEGARLLKRIQPDSLGDLAQGYELTKLLETEGTELLSGLGPLSPPSM